MNLPDFSKDSELDKLRRKMGAELIAWETVSDWKVLDIDKLLEESGGIEVPISDIQTALDGTFEYKGRKVVVYIRDQVYQVQKSSYRFHLTDCPTLKTMKRRGRYERYVVSRKTDGKFIVNMCIGGQVVKQIECQLYVCKNCLRVLDYENYRNATRATKDEIWTSFSLEEFFEIYSSGITQIPIYTGETAPINTYSSDWKEVSLRYREKINWKCEKCGLHFSNRNFGRFLHVHHKNGLKNDNRDQNLQALCIGCHAKCAQHGYLKNNPDYTDYRRYLGFYDQT